jgi:DNA topoisomerase VI, subunit A
MSANGFTKEEVIEALHSIAGEMHDNMTKGQPPRMTLPVKDQEEHRFRMKRLGVYKYGKKKSTRDATSLGSARQLLRALHVTEFIEEMINAGKSSTLREMYYISEGGGMGNSVHRTRATISLRISRSSPDACVRTSNYDLKRMGLASSATSPSRRGIDAAIG